METYRISGDSTVYFVTYSVVDWLPVFISEGACRILTENLNYCHREKNLRINAFVIMPTHMHAIVFDSEYNSDRLLQTLTAFRKYTGHLLADYAAEHLPTCFSEVFRNAAQSDRDRRFWQSSRHPEGLNSERFWRQKVNYLHDNPCRKGLVLFPEQWRFSSAQHYAGGGEARVDVEITELEW